jgi:phosphoglycolate phosphatase
MNKLALFDCDGTLVDSQLNIITCMADAFQRAGQTPPPRTAIKRIVGLSLVPAVRTLIPHAEAALQNQIAEDYKTAFHRLRGQGLVEEPLYDGILTALDTLRSDGWVLGVATGKSDRGLHLCLDHHGIRDQFVTLQTADRHPSKPDPAMVHEAIREAGASSETTIMIGDTSFDMAMGVAAGAKSLGVDWGYHDTSDLIDAGAYHVISDASDLPKAADLPAAIAANPSR